MTTAQINEAMLLRLRDERLGRPYSATLRAVREALELRNDQEADDVLHEGWELAREPAHKPAKLDCQHEPARQGKLFSGLDCLPGQEDLFATD